MHTKMMVRHLIPNFAGTFHLLEIKAAAKRARGEESGGGADQECESWL
jgi:hypothetical protein